MAWQTLYMGYLVIYSSPHLFFKLLPGISTCTSIVFALQYCVCESFSFFSCVKIYNIFVCFLSVATNSARLITTHTHCLPAHFPDTCEVHLLGTYQFSFFSALFQPHCGAVGLWASDNCVLKIRPGPR